MKHQLVFMAGASLALRGNGQAGRGPAPKESAGRGGLSFGRRSGRRVVRLSGQAAAPPGGRSSISLGHFDDDDDVQAATPPQQRRRALAVPPLAAPPALPRAVRERSRTGDDGSPTTCTGRLPRRQTLPALEKRPLVQEAQVTAAAEQPAFGVRSSQARGFTGPSYGGVNGNGGQNVNNFLTDRASSRVLAPPGGVSTLSLGWGQDPEPPRRRTRGMQREIRNNCSVSAAERAAAPASQNFPAPLELPFEPQPLPQFDDSSPRVGPPRGGGGGGGHKFLSSSSGHQASSFSTEASDERQERQSHARRQREPAPRRGRVPALVPVKPVGPAREIKPRTLEPRQTAGVRHRASVTKAPGVIPGLEAHYASRLAAIAVANA